MVSQSADKFDFDVALSFAEIKGSEIKAEIKGSEIKGSRNKGVTRNKGVRLPS